MSSQRKNFLRGILIIFISIGLLGFKNSTDPPPNENQYPNPVGLVDVTIYATSFWSSGTYTSFTVWNPASASLLITQEPNSSSYKIQSGSAFTSVISRTIVAGGEISAKIDHPMIWFINAILYPDCSVDFIFRGVNFPGVSVGCAPAPVGCIKESTPGKYVYGPIVRMPGNENIVEVDLFGANNTSTTYTIIKEFMSAGKCLYLSPTPP